MKKKERFVTALESDTVRRFGVYHYMDVIYDGKARNPMPVKKPGARPIASGFETWIDCQKHCSIINKRMGWQSKAYKEFKEKRR